MGAEFKNLIAFFPFDDARINDPQIVVFVYDNTVGPHKQAAAEAGEQIALWAELQHWIDVGNRTGAIVSSAPLEDPDVALRVNIDGIA